MKTLTSLRRNLTLLAVATIAVLIAGELFARFILGLGTPPLTTKHPTIEYLFTPSQDVMRFGNRQLYNSYSMRCEEVRKKTTDELRIIIFGDSVLNGGSLTDHNDLATTLLQKKLQASLRIPITVLHVSAGSWGPENWLAYAEEYGFFESDFVILLISSHDLSDNRTFSRLSPLTHPQEPPLCAILEGIQRYLPRYLPTIRIRAAEQQTNNAPTDDAIRRGVAALERFLGLAIATGAETAVAMFPERGETRQRPQAFSTIANVASSANAHILDLIPVLKKATQDGKHPYRDNIHITAEGQLILTNAFFNFIHHKQTEKTEH